MTLFAHDQSIASNILLTQVISTRTQDPTLLHTLIGDVHFLTDRVVHQAIMFTDHLAVHRHNLSLAGREVLRQEVCVKKEEESNLSYYALQ